MSTNLPTSGATTASRAASPIQKLPPPKQIRFVNSEGQPPTKRRRINAACRTCRKRKTRCDGKRPQCSTCKDNGHDCMGYAAGPDANIKRERKGSDNGSRNDHDDENEEDENNRIVVGTVERKGNGHAQPSSHGSLPGASPHLRRADPKQQSPPKRQDTSDSSRRSGVFTGESSIFSDEAQSPQAERSAPKHENHRVPYFRYFGPTAIVPGFKQMVVSVREHRRSTGGSSAASSNSIVAAGSIYGGTQQNSGPEPRSAIDMPMYDQNDPLPVNRLIIHLVETFFAHLGSNYPFLRQESFIQRVEEKSVEPILVDAVCGLAARFSDHPLLIGHPDSSMPKSDYGHGFAQRAKAAVVDTFPCPTVAAVQACLLLAYEGFGANQDSALWMYLGCSIRMLVDLGLQKLDGVKYQGQKDPGYHRSSNDSTHSDMPAPISAKQMEEVEQERIDTLWAVFMLDRVISSGTGRPVTLRDEDFELSFPEITSSADSGWPNPFPALIQIIHLYGRVSDLLNNIRNVKDVTPKRIEELQGMEKDLTQLYQRLDQKLTFNAANFQHYVKSGEGTNFILVHFWFHTLIMLLHQPTLMHSFEGQILSLLPHSRELSMSSAKTVADILAFAELIDPRSFIGNPFTSQPMYIAATAFLMESAAHTASQPTSRDASPPRNGDRQLDGKISRLKGISNEQKQKHTLLASAANQNYQRCYKALQQLETYWAGTRYILVALDQKAKGIWDPETYTEKEYESTKVRHDSVPNWQRKLTPPNRFSDLQSPQKEILPGSPATIDPSQAIGWSLTGTTNSPSSNLTFMYQSMPGESLQPPQLPPPPPAAPPAGNMVYDPIRSSVPETTASSTSTSFNQRYPTFTTQHQHNSHPMLPPPAPKYSFMTSGSASTSDAEMLLELQNSPFSTSNSHHSYDQTMKPPNNNNGQEHSTVSYDFSQSAGSMVNGFSGSGFMGNVSDMMMESQEIDMSSISGDLMPWLEYLPQDVLNFFDSGTANQGGSVEMAP
ncbi:related to pathway-specific nitrogen regulator [Rhynchosporium secalis]|uniref:Related to pathway-specific nitrogen regulator n=1 Tax=Rhynchosporium secalis TaxID=38038 RepID=A0A1E1LVE7_RHYSE|nr:related to pathway-specific nitrogen regulator [Rhynchosporium secalis]